jgi:hypothetical protein
MNNESWDIIATASAGPDAAWFAFRMAHSLSQHRGVRVTLYLDALDAVAQQVPQVNPSLSMQPVERFRLADHRMLSASKPSSDCLFIFDSIVPRGYLLRREQAACKSWPFALPRLGCDSMDRNEWQKAGIHVIELWGGTVERGFVKPDGNAFERREEFRARTVATSLLRLKPLLPHEGVLDERVVTVVPDGKTDLTGWVSAWIKSPWPLRLLLPRASLSSSAFNGMLQQGTNLVAGQLTVSPLPSMSWHEMDEIIWSSDLVMSNQQDIAMRAMASGTPVVTPLTGRLRLDRGELQHHAMGLVTLPVNTAAQSVAALATAWSLNEQVADRWQQVCDCWDEVQVNAKMIARRLQRLPNLASSMLDLTRARHSERSGFSAGLHSAEHRQFSITVKSIVE